MPKHLGQDKHPWIQDFLPGVGGQGLAAIKAALTFFFLLLLLFLFSFSPQLILQFNTVLSMVYFKENTIMLQGFRGVQHFPGMVTFFRGGGVKKLISIEIHITCEFPGGLDPLLPPLDTHMINLSLAENF